MKCICYTGGVEVIYMMTNEEKQNVIENVVHELRPDTAKELAKIISNFLLAMPRINISVISQEELLGIGEYLLKLASYTPDSTLKDINLENPIEIVRFLENHEYLNDLITDINAEARKYFGDTSYKLELREDYETGEEQLFFLIYSSRAIEEDMIILHEFVRNYWLYKKKLPKVK